MTSPKIVNSITKGANILKCLSDGIDRISDLSKELHLSKSTTHRFLKSLENSGLAMQDPITRRYHLGHLILYLASQPNVSHQRLIDSAAEEMQHLRDLSRETVILQVRVGIERIRLVAFESPESIRYTAGKGSVAPVYSGSAGKVLLSELKEDEFLSLIEKIQLVSVGPNTITDKKELIREVEKVRRQGYSVSIGEIVGGGAAISVPVRNYICPVALSLVGPDNRFSVDEMMRVLKEMKKSAKRISKKLQQFGPGKKKASML